MALWPGDAFGAGKAGNYRRVKVQMFIGRYSGRPGGKGSNFRP